jgi:hypothetical protein
MQSEKAEKILEKLVEDDYINKEEYNKIKSFL